MTTDLVVRRTRYALAALILIAATSLIIYTHIGSGGVEYRTSELVMLIVLRAGEFLVPTVIGIDFVLRVIRAAMSARAGDVRLAIKTITWTIVANALLLMLAFAAELAVLKWRG